MSEPDADHIKSQTRKIVLDARRAHKTSSLTTRIVRQKVEEACQLEVGTLDAREWKTIVKNAADAAVAENLKKHSPPQSGSEHEERDQAAEKEEETTGKKRKRKSNSEKSGSSKATSSKPPSSRSRSSKKFTSKDTISDSEPEGDKVVPKPEPSSPSIKKSSPTAVKRKKATRPGNDGEAQINTSVKLEDSASSSILVAPKPERNDEDDASESELSVLIDDPPKKQRKTKGSRKESKPAAKKRDKKSGPELSKDEEAIKRLKSFVVACGVRKQWAREFKDLTLPSEQIKRLREILAELGMEGRLSMEKAKEIKTKRELAKELEDVQKFEAAVVSGGPFRASRSSGSKSKGKQDSSDEENASEKSASESEPEEPTGKRKHKNAARSIMAFLQDQSDSD
ncbi:uncharacterized protein STEHIDRAFT_121905 [Stereum hirsutum FP-91666 SS1]|uniref:uncharacterized protein n=1 Tax=Stereum hirsutum (strain FP-91666) TaxID=721885 RepID=UPI000444A60C|nr:uncharacterized protein STEHIDRAFT_121905 [Stereum hirsutum FP-91666 SS1]EIM85911.1 hypothetical protein STEHIDRAFT_121905 [Stereum hirsutum FP-91666 SS1]